MRKFSWLMTAMTVVALAFVACGEDTPPTPAPTPEALSFEAKIVETTQTTMTFNLTPSNLEADYFDVVFEAKAVEQCESDADIVAMIYAEIEEYALSIDSTFEAYMAENISKGALEAEQFNSLNPDTNYYLLAFGVDAAANYALTSEVSLTRFKTLGVDMDTCTFTVHAKVNLNTAAIDVTPSNSTTTWHLVNVPVEQLTTYTAEDGEYGWTKEEFFANHLATEIETLKAQGMSTEEINTRLFHQGYKTLNTGLLLPKTKYVTLVAGVHVTEEGAWVNTNLKELRYNSGEEAASDLSFDIEVFNIEHYSAEIRITPSDLNANYYYYIGYIDNSKKSMSPVEIANAAVTEYIYYWENYTELKHRDPVTGVTELTGDNKVELNIAETEYFVVAFSFEPNPTYGTIINEETGEYDYNPGTITSAPIYVSFMTAEQGDPMAAEFTFSASDVGPYDFYLEIQAEDPTIYYQPGIAYADNFDPQAAISASSSLLAQLVQMTMEGQSPSLTFWEALEERLGSYYRNGDGKYYVANLEPNRDYIGYVLVIDANSRQFVRCVYSDVIATTTNVGSVTPEIELLGVYNGNHEAGTIFGDAAMTSGRPIVAVKFNNIENATAVYSALSTDSYADVASLSDRYIISEFRGYWQELTSLNVPYHFFIADWDYEQTVVAYAQDANGHEAAVAKLGVKPSQTNDIEELRGYVDAVNNATPKALSKSLVVAEVSEPSMECIWSEEVGAPRAARVVRHECDWQGANIQCDIMSLEMVKSFFVR